MSCTGYTVKTSKLALIAAAQAEQSELKLPAATIGTSVSISAPPSAGTAPYPVLLNSLSKNATS